MLLSSVQRDAYSYAERNSRENKLLQWDNILAKQLQVRHASIRDIIGDQIVDQCSTYEDHMTIRVILQTDIDYVYWDTIVHQYGQDYLNIIMHGLLHNMPAWNVEITSQAYSNDNIADVITQARSKYGTYVFGQFQPARLFFGAEVLELGDNRIRYQDGKMILPDGMVYKDERKKQYLIKLNPSSRKQKSTCYYLYYRLILTPTNNYLYHPTPENLIIHKQNNPHIYSDDDSSESIWS